MKIKKTKLLVVMAGVLATLTIFTMIGSISGSVEMTELDKKFAVALENKKQLNESLVKMNSTTDLESRSSEMGFANASDIVYVTKVSPVAQLQ